MTGPVPRPPLVVVGSTNIDITLHLDHRPAAGETVVAAGRTVRTGGKGANQALAAARAGAASILVSAVGEDGDRALRLLARHGVDLRHVRRVPGRSGEALVLLTRDGENSIVVLPGANDDLDPETVEAALTGGGAAGAVVLLQCEIPGPTVAATARVAAGRGSRVVLNLAPPCAVPEDVLAVCDPLVVNESEAAVVSGLPVDDVPQALRTARALAARCRSVVITLGGAGAVLATGDDVRHVPGEQARVVDTTGAGDAFVGTLAARLACGDDLLAAVRAGNTAGARAVEHAGAQPPEPTEALA